MNAPLQLILWMLAALCMIPACAGTKPAVFVPTPDTRVEVEARDGRKGEVSTGELREVIGVGVPNTDVVALVVDTREPLELSSINRTIVYLSDELNRELELIAPDANGLIGYERTKTVNVYRGAGGHNFGGALLDVLVGPRQQQVRARSMKPAIAQLETHHVRNREVVTIPDGLAAGIYVLTDRHTYMVLKVVESSWADVSYEERLRRTRDNPRAFGIRGDLSIARVEGAASASSSDEDSLFDNPLPSGRYRGTGARILIAPSFRLPAWRLLSVELYAGPALMLAGPGRMSTPSLAAGGMAFTMGARPEVPLVAFGPRSGVSFGLDLRFDVGLLSSGEYLVSTGAEFSLTPDLAFHLRRMTLGLGLGYQVVDRSAMGRFSVRF